MLKISFLTKNKNLFYNIVKLLSSGVLTTLGFVVLASGRMTSVSSEMSLFFLLFIQFQMIGLTIAKLGLDNLIYAKYITDNSFKYCPIVYLKQKGIYLVILMTLSYCFFFSFKYSIFFFFTLIFDIISVLSLIQITSRELYMKGLLVSLASYPLFFLLLFCLNLLITLTKIDLLLIFMFCSFLKFLLSYYFFNKIEGEYSPLEINYKMAIQQILNYTLFKTDQIIFSIGIIAAYYFKYSTNDLEKFIFLSKLPEIISGVLVSLMVLYAPKLYIDSKNKFVTLLRTYKYYILTYVTILIVVAYIYTFFWNKAGLLTFWLVLPYLIHTVMIIVINMISLGYLKTQNISLLNKSLAISISSGLLVAVFSIIFNINDAIIWIVPLQMIVFSLLVFIIPVKCRLNESK